MINVDLYSAPVHFKSSHYTIICKFSLYRIRLLYNDLHSYIVYLHMNKCQLSIEYNPILFSVIFFFFTFKLSNLKGFQHNPRIARIVQSTSLLASASACLSLYHSIFSLQSTIEKCMKFVEMFKNSGGGMKRMQFWHVLQIWFAIKHPHLGWILYFTTISSVVRSPQKDWYRFS